jgi:hypothetical protein
MANKIYIKPETSMKFADSAQSPDETLTLANLVAGSGQISDRHDLGSIARSEWYEWRATFQFDTAPVVGESVDIYISTSDGTNEDGQEGISDTVIGNIESIKNMSYIGSVIVTSVDIDHDMTTAGICRIVSRYFSVIVHNNTADNLKNSTGVNMVMITPIPPEV